MSEGRTAAGTARRAGFGPTRLVRAWRTLPHESRLAAFASLGLFVTLFLPWYQLTLIAPARASRLESASTTITGWGAFSFVEAAVLLVAAGVLILLFQRAEGRAFHLPGGDGGVIAAAGLWTCLLIVWRIFDKQGATTHGPSATSSGVEWGIFIALAAAAFLAYSGSRIRAAHRPEPPLPGEDRPPAGSSSATTSVLRARRDSDGRPRRDSDARPRRDSDARPRRDSDARPRRDPDAPERPRRRARPPMPVPADPPTVVDPPASRVDPPPPSQPASDRPRRRPSAAELFEPVVPDDPPTMRLSRIKPSPVNPLADDATVPLGDDATQPLGEDATQVLGEDATLPLDDRPRRH